MKELTFGLLVLACLTAGGCGGDGTNQSTQNSSNDSSNRVVAQKPIAGEAERTFSLTVPFEPVSLTQGGEETVRLGINRGENFREAVEIKLSELPVGISVDSTDMVIEPGSTGSTFILKATPDAALGDFTIKVIGQTSSSGADFSTDLNLTVKQAGNQVDNQVENQPGNQQ